MRGSSSSTKAPSVNSRRTLATLAALAALATPLAFVDGADAARDGHGDPVPSIPDIRTVNGRSATASSDTGSQRLHGIDGLFYDYAPVAVPGLGDELFWGPDFDLACGVGGRFERAMKAAARMARIIERSGRRVVWTLGLNKSAVLPERLDAATLPQGSCDTLGLAQQTKVITDFRDPNYLPLLNKLARSSHQVYFKTDPHWTTVGGSVFAKALATRLDSKLGRRQHYSYGTETRVGMLNYLRSIDTPETAETARPTTAVRVRTARGSADWGGYPELTYDHSWVTKPAHRTYPGHTLLFGDSFMMFALDSLRPLFRHGRWMWYAHTDLDDVVDAVRDADTVVIELAQIFTPGSYITSTSFKRHLRRVLR